MLRYIVKSFIPKIPNPKIIKNQYKSPKKSNNKTTLRFELKGDLYMKATGIVRRIDDLGRVVIPKEIRRTMRIREGDPSWNLLLHNTRNQVTQGIGRI